MSAPGELWDGIRFVLESPLSLAAVVALASIIYRREAWIQAAAGAGVGAAAVPLMPEQLANVSAAIVAVLGLLAALRCNPPRLTAPLLSVLAGGAAGYSAEFHWATLPELASGIALIAGLAGALTFGATRLARHHTRGPTVQLGAAVIGSWVLALSTLVLIMRAVGA